MSTVVTPATRRWRIGLVIGGLSLLGIGVITLLGDVDPKNYIGIVVWFAGALILHDGIAAMVVFGISVFMRRFGRRIPYTVLAIVQGALVIGAIFTAIVVPEILKSAIGTANPTILPLDYGRNLLLFYAGLAIVTAVAIVGYLAFARSRKQRA